MVYAELATHTNFSFLRGASHARDLVLTALLLGQSGIGIADRNTVAGVVRAHATLEELRTEGLPPPERVREGSGPGEITFVEAPRPDLSQEVVKAAASRFRLAVGSRLVFCDGSPEVIVYPQNRVGWGRLCRLLTTGNLRGRKGECRLILDDLAADTRDLLLIVMPGEDEAALTRTLQTLGEAAPGQLWLAATMGRDGEDRRRLFGLRDMATARGLPLLAVNDVLYHDPAQRDLQDVLTCIREGVTIEEAGFRLQAHAERHLKPPAEMARLFRDCPEAVAETQNLLARIDFSLSELKYEYPQEPVPPGWTPQGWLEKITWERAAHRYGGTVPEKVRKLLADELALIAQLDYARYFLTIVDIVRVAEDKGILCQGRGSAANSAVCYVLGITAVDPNDHDLLFARFISSERKEPPDIDVDFEHERREEVIQHIYARYGRERAGIAATVISYRPRSAIREVGKALGLTEDVTGRLAGMVWGSWGTEIGDHYVREAGLDPKNPLIRRAVDLASRLIGFPRHLSQHVGGFVLTGGRLDETVPIGNAAMADRTFIEWDKDDIDALGLMKVDVLALGMLTCIRKAFALLRDTGGPDLDLATVPPEDPAVYEMLCRGDSIGVFQVESRAQINMLPRLKPRKLYDLVIQVAIVRPGPIEGDMVHPYLKRRAGLEPVVYPSPAPEHGEPDELYQVLNKTCGVPLFQEQAMRLAMVAAKFTADEANGLRRAMATFRNVGTIGRFERLMVDRMVARGYDPAFARRCFDQIKGFGSYGFPESHAASFAKLVYISSWIKCHHPAIFACALLNAQPMGFYAPAQIVRDAREHGVEVRAVDVNASCFDNTLERDGEGSALALRLGFRQLDGFHLAWAERLAAARSRPFRDVEDLARRAALPARALRILADADAFRSLGLDRREAAWAVRRLPDDDPLPLFAAADAKELGTDADANLPAMPLSEHVVADYQTVRLSLKAHPLAFLRQRFRTEGVMTCAEISAAANGAPAQAAGVVLVRQRPGKGTAVFITLEDETGITNVVLWARRMEAFRRAIMGGRLLLVRGVVQRSPEGVVHLMAEDIIDRTADLSLLSEDAMRDSLARADEVNRPQYPRTGGRHPRDVRVLPKSRDFH
ncbi:error-prone DNA polymerase [Phreatobacter oligotrophus]|jgi:error-prone DNA polymerase|uniref:error-prone DNA polymerase n=2 Tax=Pseudomonadota TaxID=1224 RepID=UPI0023569D5C|nr:error-prone DNA polymerase [Phreatobacter oligotrophus]MBX9990676.1 error-prone DNA polymerase [Phreatobacter oligotrophus]